MKFQTITVFMVTNVAGEVHVGVTRNLRNQMQRYRNGSETPPGWSLPVEKLIFFSHLPRLDWALALEKTLVRFSRRSRLAVARRLNPELRDLSLGVWEPLVSHAVLDSDLAAPWYEAQPTTASPWADRN